MHVRARPDEGPGRVGSRLGCLAAIQTRLYRLESDPVVIWPDDDTPAEPQIHGKPARGGP